jgi:hypothetical protein
MSFLATPPWVRAETTDATSTSFWLRAAATDPADVVTAATAVRRFGVALA